MASAHNQRPGQIYSRNYFDASKTWEAWNKLSAKDVFALTEQPGFEGQHVYFHKNHPIQYVYLCGLITNIDFAPGAGAAKYVLLLLDDGSGQRIEVKIPRRHAKDLENNPLAYPSNTLVDNVDVNDQWHFLKLPSLLYINDKPVCEGAVIKVKGTITKFRERQVELKRIFIVGDTNEEVNFWASMAELRRDVLSKPWVLTPAEMQAFDDNIEAEYRREQEGFKNSRARNAERKERKEKNDVKRETRRKKTEEKLNDGALKGSNIIREAWENW